MNRFSRFLANALVTGTVFTAICSYPALAQMSDVTGEQQNTSVATDTPSFYVTLKNNKDEKIGAVLIEDADTGSLLTVEVAGVSAGWHAFHIHEKGDCTDLEEFKSAGGHAAFDGQMHGLLDEENIHAGDLPNIWVHGDGVGKAQIYIAEDIFDSLNDEDGSAFVMHAGGDDYKTDPAGAAGGRIACGVIYNAVSE